MPRTSSASATPSCSPGWRSARTDAAPASDLRFSDVGEKKHLVGLPSAGAVGGEVHGKGVRPGQRGELVPPLTYNLKHEMGLKLLGENILEVYLGDIKTENEVQRKIVFILVGKHTEPLEGLFGIFIIAENDPVKDGDEAIEDAVGDEGLPDALVYAARPEEEDSVEAEARRL